MSLLFDIGFLPIRFIDFVDVFLVALLIYQLYRLVRGSLAFNILIGLLIVFVGSLIVRALNMRLLSDILGQFVGLGVIAVLIVFQPEVRRFLLYIGRGRTLSTEGFWRGFSLKSWRARTERHGQLVQIMRAVERLSTRRTGALIVYAVTSRLQLTASTGVQINAQISSELLESLFHKNNPLHDGAVIIAGGRIIAARCVLPVSDSVNLQPDLGLRHRSAVGMSEQSDAIVIVVSEFKGHISYAHEGKLRRDVTMAELRLAISRIIAEQPAQPTSEAGATGQTVTN